MIREKKNIDASRISNRAQSIEESITLSIADKAKKMCLAGIDVISLSTGEPDFPTPDVIKEAGIKAIEDNFTKYTSANGILELRVEVAKKLINQNNIQATENDVLISAGGKQALMNSLFATVNDGDEIIIPSPYWTSYPEMVKLAGGIPVILKTTVTNNFKLTIEDLYNCITPNTKGIILNSPCNPTGTIYTQIELIEISKVIEEVGIYVYSDELYENIIYNNSKHFSIGSLSNVKNYVITINGLSKAYSMTGWRMGYVHAPKDVLNACAKIQSQSTSHPSSISQKAGLAALKYANNDVEIMRVSFEKRMNLTKELLSDIPKIKFNTPSGAFYFFFDISKYYNNNFNSSFIVADYLLNEFKVAVIPGSAFGDDNSIRISFATSEECIIEGISRIKNGLLSIIESENK
ncbi:MAG: pyridoxal phosphate-dependent aminotransferase [Chlorobiota bacterium]|nr:pyridoxal phosphate-dependent aminotransferase [Chlorobiota bacterium]QQS67743.1 MAG: pyridoxal phosphate-dependent aminotransferase [Chlorobiota bacterium]